VKNFLEAAVVAVAVGFVVFILAGIIGGIPSLTVIRTYAGAIGLVAGVLVFIRRWDFNF
jgi:hypothetical protein